ncbi:ABC transporter permease [Gemmatimonadota bacterium Y43]|uniref:ABC transporter permease n=1 Tax=Gaopeijia maritima TaxID=3119007 RepID=UPI003277B864
MTPARQGGPLFRLALRLLPRRLREEHGAEMTELYRARLERATGAVARARARIRGVADIVATALATRAGRRSAADGFTGRRRGGGWTMDATLQELRQTVRNLARSPGFTLGAVALLAIGIGVNTTVFTVVDALLFRPPPWDEAERVVHIYQHSDEGEPSSTSFPAYRDMAALDLFESVGATVPWSARWERGDERIEVDVEYATSTLLDVLGLAPDRGRWFEAALDRPGAGFAAVVSFPTWVSRFGADPDVVGSTVVLNGEAVTIVGVGPRTLPSSFPPFVTDFWLSISSTPLGGQFMVDNLERRADHWYDVRARLAPGATVAQASAAMEALAARLAADFPEFNEGRDISVFAADDIRTHPTSDGDLFAAGTLLAAVVGVILLLACANLANLLLVRGLGRAGEMAVRRALGAGRTRVARLFLFEALILSVIGGGLGVLLTAWAVRLIPTLPPPGVFPGLLELHLDGRVLVWALALVVATGLLFGVAPALRAARTDLSGTLRDEGRTSSLGRGTARMRNALLAIQVAASLVLVLGTGLLVRSLAATGAADPGIAVDRLAWIRTDLAAVAESPEERRILLDQLRERLAALPGVEGVAATSRLPAQFGGSTTTEVEDYSPPSGTGATELDFAVVDDGYFAAAGLHLLAGRGFGPDDVADGPTAIVINETAARTFWGEVEVVGRRMRGQGSENWTRTVVGVVSDAPVSTLSEDVPPAFYFSERQLGGIAAPYLIVRTADEPATVLPSLRAALAEARPALSVDGLGTLADHFGSTLAGPRLATLLVGAFSLLAAVLAGLGIYGIVSFGVARRTSELGIRMALGAGRRRVVGMVLRDVAGMVFWGLLAGLAAAAIVAPRVAALLYGVNGGDPLAFGGAIVFIVAVAAFAAWLPARRAASADPAAALRGS